jgi:hypothetical protein
LERIQYQVPEWHYREELGRTSSKFSQDKIETMSEESQRMMLALMMKMNRRATHRPSSFFWPGGY